MDNHVNITVTEGSDGFLSADVYRSLYLRPSEPTTIRVGHSSAEVVLHPLANSRRSELRLPGPVLEQLHLLPGMPLNLWKSGSALRLGPVVGIFVRPDYLTAIAQGRVPLTAKKDVQANAVAKCLITFFSVDGIRWEEQTIRGWTYSPAHKRWISRWFPFPDVIYDRGVHYPPSLKPKVKAARARFRADPHIQFINNSDYLGKWELYTRLSQYPEMRPYLPETRRYESIRDLETMLQNHPLVYIKSFYGSQGKEVMSVAKVTKGYRVKFYHNGIQRWRAVSLSQIETWIRRFFGNKPLVLQRGIDLLTYKGRRIDLRVLLCKDGTGQWKAIYNQANVSLPGSTITTIGRNFKNYTDVYRLFRRIGKPARLPTDDTIRRETIRIARYIDKAFGPQGELGMDMAVDRQGKIWFIEANTRPEKLPIPGLEDTRGVSPQFLAVFQYATFLTKHQQP
ncbi:MAG: hypothetical protein A6D91_03585 [Bacillaceae bacterium G1]|nr:MAG: hypothetical protein A6D91_03585 [Bacillaceae bacterium G1]